MSGITLNAAMRANLLSLQNTANLQAQTQERLATGLKVNSALDNPTSYFAAQALNDRASDLSNLLDGMGQAIQTITAASQGITAAESLITSMQSIATTASQSAAAAAAAAAKPGTVVAQGTVTPAGLVASNTGAATADSTDLLTNLSNSAGANLGIAVGATLVSSAAAATFVVTATSTLKDLQSFLETKGNVGGAGDTATTSINSSGDLVINSSAAETFEGSVATALGLGAATPGTPDTGTVGIHVGPYQASDSVASSTKGQLLTGLVGSNGQSLNIANGDTLTFNYNGGTTYTFTVGAAAYASAGANGGGSTLADLENWIDAQGSANEATVVGGRLTIAGATDAQIVGGTLASELGVNGTVAAGATAALSGSVQAYVQPQTAVPLASSSSLVQNLTEADGAMLGTNSASAKGVTSVGNTITIDVGGSTSTTTITGTMTVQDLLQQLDAANSSLSFSLSASGQLVGDNETGATVTLGGTAEPGLFGTTSLANNVAGSPTTFTPKLYGGYATPASSTTTQQISASYMSQFDTLRTQLNQLVQDSSYQGINLISGTTNNPLTVQFNNTAGTPNELVIDAVDLTTTGLGINAASGTAAGSWQTASDVQSTLTALTNANATLRAQASSLGTNLTTVQTRQDFTNNMINTLQTGSGDLVNADMNTESANMLALQTQQQLGISSLSLASQAAQGILKLFP